MTNNFKKKQLLTQQDNIVIDVDLTCDSYISTADVLSLLVFSKVFLLFCCTYQISRNVKIAKFYEENCIQIDNISDNLEQCFLHTIKQLLILVCTYFSLLLMTCKKKVNNLSLISLINCLVEVFVFVLQHTENAVTMNVSTCIWVIFQQLLTCKGFILRDLFTVLQNDNF